MADRRTGLVWWEQAGRRVGRRTGRQAGGIGQRSAPALCRSWQNSSCDRHPCTHTTLQCWHPALQGKIQGNEFIVIDTFALPVEGTETRVNAQVCAGMAGGGCRLGGGSSA